MLIGVIGSNGFVGSKLVEELSTYHNVQGIDKQNYRNLIGTSYDLLINANGNSRKWFANENPLIDFNLSVKSVYQSLFDFGFKKYVYISSIDSVLSTDYYGFHKHVAEELIWRYCDKNNINFSLLRCGTIVGQGMKKGVVYDILNDIPLRVTANSRICLTDIELIINNLGPQEERETNIFSKNSIKVEKIAKMLGKNLTFSNKTEHQDYSWVNTDCKITAEKILKRSVL